MNMESFFPWPGPSRGLTWPLLAGAVAGALTVSVQGDGNPLNGAHPRPFYVFEHNPNTVGDAEAALKAGANALEPDVEASSDNAGLLNGTLIVNHTQEGSNPNTLEAYLQGLHQLAVNYPQLALVVCDIKSEAASPGNGEKILEAIRKYLNTGGINVNVILSVATKDDLGVFDKILDSLGPREGVQVDAEDDPGAVVNYFFDRHYYGNIGYGDGTLGPGPHLPTAIDAAAFDRAALGYPKVVTYVYTIKLASSMHMFIESGVDGIIPGGFSAGPDPDYVATLLQIVDEHTDIVLATRQDNPFQHLNEAYGLRVVTSDDFSAGTDAHLTFELEGELGTATTTVDSEPTGRMEEGSVNYVTIPSKNLGPLKSITVSRDDAGNAPDWKLQEISIYSAVWLKPDLAYHYTATLNDWVDSDSPRVLTLTPEFPAPQVLNDEYVWSATDRGYQDGTSTAPWKAIGEAYQWVQAGGTIHVAPGAYRENLTFAKPCRFKLWDAHSQGPIVIGSP
jgi:hypothetical protein